MLKTRMQCSLTFGSGDSTLYEALATFNLNISRLIMLLKLIPTKQLT